MKDARGIPISVGQSVAMLRSKEMDFGRHSSIAWGVITKIGPKMISVRSTGGNVVSRMPHNVLVAQFDVAFDTVGAE